MTDAQRDLLVKGLSDIAKGVLIGAFLAQGTGKLPLSYTLIASGSAVLLFGMAYLLAGGPHDGA